MRDFQLNGRSPVYGIHGMAATTMPLATLTALDILKSGGNAVDAAIAAVALLGVIEPQSTGIGGDCFCLLARPGEQPIAMNGSGRTPAASSIDHFESLGLHQIPSDSPHAVTVPGAVAGWDLLARHHGTRTLGELLRPAIHTAENGWPIAARVAWDWAQAAEKLRQSGAHTLLPGGKAPVSGQHWRQPALAATLRRIAILGSQGFYEGPVARYLVRFLRERGGLHRLEDFATGATSAEFVTPISLDWRGHRVWQCPPNGGGVSALMMLGILDHLKAPVGEPLATRRLHRQIEAARLAFRDRDAFIADHRSCGAASVDRLLDPSYLQKLAALIDDERALKNLPAAGAASLPQHRDTVYLSVVDRDGMACSLINSLFDDFGGGLHEPTTGVTLHNRASGFRLERDHPNCMGPGKRPLHTILPGLLTRDDLPIMPFGVTGGHFQPVGQTHFLTNMFDHGLDIQEAMDLPRVFPNGDQLLLEAGIPEAAWHGLKQLGHAGVARAARPHGGGQAIWIDAQRGVLCGASDPRRDGCAAGY